jgi:tripartite-type tricarboxylate transporter receptor subunit TctC
VTTLKRSPQFPDIPAISETVPGYEVSSWYGLAGPKGLPPAIVDRLHREIAAIFATPEAIATLAKDGAQPAVNTPEEFHARIHNEIARWREVVATAGIKVD